MSQATAYDTALSHTDQEFPEALAVFWFRRDLRLDDNRGLTEALQSGLPVLPVFVFDREILSDLEDRDDRRVSFIHREIERLHRELEDLGSPMLVGYGKPLEFFETLVERYPVKAVFTNEDYEPYARERDQQVGDLLEQKGITFQAFKDHVIFAGSEVVKADGKPYTVYTPYKNLWRKSITPEAFADCGTNQQWAHFWKATSRPIPTLEEMGFEPNYTHLPPSDLDLDLVQEYGETRNTPAIIGTTRLGVHLRFGTVSIRGLVRAAWNSPETWVNELVWRDFFSMILWHFPHTITMAFKPKYDRIPWRENAAGLEAWKQGKTGFPMVDAGMRELNATGFMHNRVRMVTASFLVKHLLIDWRVGEAYFARKLLDFDLSSNVGNWQWAAGSGCDAAPYFRIFNPERQQAKFDPQAKYIHQWVPEYDTSAYPKPIVNHATQRKETLEVYKAALAE